MKALYSAFAALMCCSLFAGVFASHTSSGSGYYRPDGLFVGANTRYAGYDFYNRSYSYDVYYDRYYDDRSYDNYYRDSYTSCVDEGEYAGGGYVPYGEPSYRCCSGLTKVEHKDGDRIADIGKTCIDIDGYCDTKYESSYNSSDCRSNNRYNNDRYYDDYDDYYSVRRSGNYYINISNSNTNTNNNGYPSNTSCGYKPANSHWASGSGYQPRCDWQCDSGYTQSGNTCVYNNPTYCTQNVVCAYKSGSYKWYGNGCLANDDGAYVVNDSYCQNTQNHCTNGATNYPYCNSCAYGQVFVNGRCSSTQSCQNKPYNATWNSGHGTYEPNCSWTCNAGYYRTGDNCIANTCSNGASNYPNCNTCPSGKVYSNGYCVTQSSCSNGATNYPYCNSCPYGQTYVNGVCTTQSSCSNGATNYPYCNTCPNGKVYSNGYCVTQNTCSNGATNYPYCNSCPYGQVYSNGYCQSEQYTWYTGNYGSCSATCGGGVQTRTVECRNTSGAHVSDSLCNAATKPQVSQSCNTHTCQTAVNGVCGSTAHTCSAGYVSNIADTNTTYLWSCVGYNGGSTASCSAAKNNQTYSWITGIYSACQNNIKTRSVTCQNSSGQIVSDSYCTGTKPSTQESCNSTTYSYSWYIGSYSACSKTCGGGIKTRTVYCQRNDGVQVSDNNCGGSKPSTQVPCNEQGCLLWYQNSGSQTCNQLCTSKGKKWVENPAGEACASGERRPQNTNININYKFGTKGNNRNGGYNIWTYNGKFYCYGHGQTRDYDETDRVVACLCQ